MLKSTILTVLTVVVAAALAVTTALLIVNGAEAVPRQPNVPVFTYGSG
jgi:hypothetical protein